MAQLPMPSQGGSYTRMPDGSLQRATDETDAVTVAGADQAEPAAAEDAAAAEADASTSSATAKRRGKETT